MSKRDIFLVIFVIFMLGLAFWQINLDLPLILILFLVTLSIIFNLETKISLSAGIFLLFANNIFSALDRTDLTNDHFRVYSLILIGYWFFDLFYKYLASLLTQFGRKWAKLVKALARSRERAKGQITKDKPIDMPVKIVEANSQRISLYQRCVLVIKWLVVKLKLVIKMIGRAPRTLLKIISQILWALSKMIGRALWTFFISGTKGLIKIFSNFLKLILRIEFAVWIKTLILFLSTTLFLVVLKWHLVNVILILFLVVTIIFGLSGLMAIILALVCLITSQIYLLYGQKPPAEYFSIYAYFLFAISVTAYLFRFFKMERVED